MVCVSEEAWDAAGKAEVSAEGCGDLLGLAEYYGWDVNFLRVLVLVLTFASSGLVGLAYAVAWVLIPEAAYALPGEARTSAS